MSNYDRYISYEDAVSRIRDTSFSLIDQGLSLQYYHENIIRQRAERSLSKCGSVDLTEVVRCKACKYMGTDKCGIKNMDREDFCSRGEKKELRIVHHDYTEVQKDKFYDFINNYPKELDKHGIYFCTPAIIQYNDFPENFDPYSEHPDNYCVAYRKEGVLGYSRDTYYVRSDLFSLD